MKTKLAHFVLLMLFATTVVAEEIHCGEYSSGKKNVYWGDLHVHSAYSLDAWGFGTLQNPAQAYAFARGKPIDLAGAGSVTIGRPLDFMAVTDHAEWFNLMYICTDPVWSKHPYCNTLTTKNSTESGGLVFREYVLPTITKREPQPTLLCQQDEAHCKEAKLSQWQRIQKQTNQANDPCSFTAFNGYEWSATPDYSHTHRNIIFASENVTEDAVDYMSYPEPEALWAELAKQCQEKDGCEAIAIPHNSNMSDGKSFDVEGISEQSRVLRARYERLIEIHQEKGNSECLPMYGDTDEDCNFEIRLTKNSAPGKPADYTPVEWETMRRGYVRGLLSAGLEAFEKSGNQLNPLQLGIISSTDNHAATPGFVEEDEWQGAVFGIGSFDRMMARKKFNPGGLVAVWAEENTRASLFSALKRREVYGTSGPRMKIKLDVAVDGAELSCEGDDGSDVISMGGEFTESNGPITFRVQALYDEIPLQSVEIIKGEYKEGELTETIYRIWDKAGLNVCRTWQDQNFDKKSPAFWYTRVKQGATPRWSAVHCKAVNRCDEFPEAQITIQERGWSSPIWYLPPAS